jgi:hypothetical protein
MGTKSNFAANDITVDSVATSAATARAFFSTSYILLISSPFELTTLLPSLENWASQFIKLKSRFAKGRENTITSAGGVQKMICLALHKLAACLNTISPNKVHPDIRERVLHYQEECDDILYEYRPRSWQPSSHR